MRVTNHQIYDQSIKTISDRYASAADIQLRLSTGKRILKPSDDPTGSARVMELTQRISQNDRFLENTKLADSRLNIENTALESVTALIQRSNQLAIQGGSDSAGADDRLAIAVEMRQTISQLVSLANTKDINDNFLFAGSRSNTTPFTEAGGIVTYNGDQTPQKMQISSNKTVTVGDTGYETFMSLKDANGANTDIFRALDTFADNMEADTYSVDDLTNINNALDKVLAMRSEVGARLNNIQTQKNVNEDVSLNFTAIKAEIQEIDVISAISKFQQEMTALETAQKSFAKIQNSSLFNYI